MTAPSAVFAARFERAHTKSRPKAEAPAHALSFTLIAVGTAYALLFVPPGRLEYGDVGAAGILGAALVALALCWPWTPRLATMGVPIGYIALAALLREAAGGATSGFGGLFLLPVLWLAVTAGRRELAAITGLMVQRLVSEARQRASLLEEHTHSLTRVSAQLAEQNERLLALDRLKDEFVATASHELRTPLTSLKGYLEMSLDPAEGPLSPSRETHLRIVQRNADRLTLLVDQLLFLARADSHPLELDRRPVDLGTILHEAAETARPAADAKGIALLTEVERPQRVLADRPQLVRIVDNLVTNAVKFTPDGGTVQLAARALGDCAVLEVTDSGMGIPSGEQSDLFKRFFRGRKAIEGAVPGSGLGLAISQVIAEAHGASIEVESVVGRGSTFRLALPLA